ncbi:MAG: lytic transglycosylase domain-containing protein [Myxococcales bacterium]|nr:lytic transglycosylase domain-containing protein [Myxococcales bacterium]
MSLNLAVRKVGSSKPALLSPFHLDDKASALASRVVHVLRHDDRCEEAMVKRIVRAAAQRHGLSPALAMSVARSESSFRPHVISRTGAMGVMQLMPDTAAALGVEDPFDPEQNADGGVRYLRRLLSRYRGNRAQALAAYNAGPGRVRRGAQRLPRATLRYVRRTLDRL